MASPLSTTTLLLLLLFLSLSIPSLSEKTQLPTKKNPLPTKKILEVIEESEEEEEQPISKPKKNPLPTKKSKQVVVEEEEEEQPISKPKKNPPPTKKPKPKQVVVAAEEGEEEEQPISKPKKNPLPTKKPKQVAAEGEEEEQPISKPKKNPLPTKKPKQVAAEGEEEEQPISKPKKNPLPTKKPKQVAAEGEEEEQPISKPKKTSLPTKKSKDVVAAAAEEEEEGKQPKPKKIPSDNFKNQTKVVVLLKPKKPKSNSSTAATKTTQSLNPKPSKIESPAAAAKESEKPDPIWLDDPSEEEDIISEFRDLPTRIQSSLLPDLRKISITSRAYIYRANRELTSRVKPFVGGSFAPRVAVAASCALLLLLPLLLLALFFYTLNSYVSLQRFLLFVQAYLAVYFLTLSLSALALGLEPLRFFHATSPSAYAWTQAVQTLAYVLYLLVQAVNLLVVFSAGEAGPGAKSLALAQVAVGLAVGLHYYAAVFHRAVAGEPPRASWKVHAVYAGCFLTVCAFARDAERRKKAYDGGEDGKKN